MVVRGQINCLASRGFEAFLVSQNTEQFGESDIGSHILGVHFQNPTQAELRLLEFIESEKGLRKTMVQ